MLRILSTVVVLAIAEPLMAAPPSLTAAFEGRMVATPGAVLFVQVGGSGDPVVLLHGYVESGDTWGPVASELGKHHTVIVPDLRGLGRSSRPANGYHKKTQAAEVRAVVPPLAWYPATVRRPGLAR